MARDELGRTRRLWDRYAARYDRRIERAERLLFPGGREWACGRAEGRVLEVAVGTGRNLQTRRPLPLVIAAGFVVDHSERARSGWIERLVATKPKV